MRRCFAPRRARVPAFLGPMLAAVLLASAPIGAQAPATPEPTLAPGPGMELTMQRCVICHEAQHITRSRLTRAEWLENTELMIKRGAPVAAGEIAPIVDYLFAFYGRNDDGSARPRPAGAAAAASAAAPSAGGSRDVQTLLGTSQKVNDARQRASQEQGNQLSVALELQADCYAGVWAHHAHRPWNRRALLPTAMGKEQRPRASCLRAGLQPPYRLTTR